MESRYLTSAILPKRLSCSASRGPALVFAPFLSSPNLGESCISESGQSCNLRARGYCNDYEDEDELKLNSAQHARSAASRLDDVIDRSALEQAREGSGGRDIEEPLIGLEVQKSTLEW